MRTARGLLLILTVGCSSATDVGRDLEVRTSRAGYEVGDLIAVRIINPSRGDIYVAHCNHRVSLLLERRVGDEWEHYRQVNGPMCLGIYPMGELRVEAGGELAETLQVDAAGEFRLQLYARRAHEDFGSLAVTSKLFTVRYPPD